MLRTAILILGSLLSCGAIANESNVELTYRLQPSRDLVTDNVIEGVTTIRVIEDRGVIAKSGGRLSLMPMTVTMKRSQSFRYITGDASADGSFSAEMRFLERNTSLKNADGTEQILPERSSLKGASVLAVIESSGALRPNSVALKGLEAALSDQVRPIMESVLSQAASIPSVLLSPGKEVLQDMQMQVPIPGIAAFDIKMKISNRLLKVENGVARIQQVFTMDFGAGPAETKVTADGSGGGTIAFDMNSKTVLSTESITIMRMQVDAPDGTVEIRMNSKQVQSSRMVAAEAR
jgi:hypothetical protein